MRGLKPLLELEVLFLSMNDYNEIHTYTLNAYEGPVHWAIKTILYENIKLVSSMGSFQLDASNISPLDELFAWTKWISGSGSGLYNLNRGNSRWHDFSILDVAPITLGDIPWIERPNKKETVIQPDVQTAMKGVSGVRNMYEVIDSNPPTFKKLVQFVESNVNVVLIDARTRTYGLQQNITPTTSTYDGKWYWNNYWNTLTEASMGWRGDMPRWQKMLIAYLFRTQPREERALRVTYSKRKEEFYLYTEYNMDMKPRSEPFKLADVKRLEEKTDNFTKFNKGIDNKQAMIMYILPALLKIHGGENFEYHLPSWSQLKQQMVYKRRQELINKIYELKDIEKDIPQPDNFLRLAYEMGGVESFFKKSLTSA